MQQAPTLLGELTVVPGKEHNYAIMKNKAVEGQIYLFHCPECGTYGLQKATIGPKPLNLWKCPKCPVKVFFQTVSQAPVSEAPKDPQQPSFPQAPVSEAPASEKEAEQKKEKHPSVPTHKFQTASDSTAAILTWAGFLLKNKYQLTPGEHIIGRKDPVKQSSLMINDKYASSRSIRIDVTPVDENQSGFLYKLTVLKATNPVYHNSRELAEGSSLYLEYGDIIILGKTQLTFNKGK